MIQLHHLGGFPEKISRYLTIVLICYASSSGLLLMCCIRPTNWFYITRIYELAH
jgi:hypothetical protein